MASRFLPVPHAQAACAASLLFVLLVGACKHPTPAAPDAAPLAAPGFLKGQLHVHTTASGDGKLSVGEVIELYRVHGYDFIVLTDHNRVAELPPPSDLLVLPGVELTNNLRACDPPPPPEQPCLMHVNALLIDPARTTAEALAQAVTPESDAIPPRLEVFRRSFEAVARLGGIAQLNHPNLYFGADADILVALSGAGLRLFEVANEGGETANEGDATHPSTEALWDAALDRGARLFATASDDLHEASEVDRGFVMVRAAKDVSAIRAALERGDFYASTGLLLDRLELAPDAIAIDVRASQAPAVFEVVGPGGRVVQRAEGWGLRLDPRALVLPWVRIRVTATDGRRAWTQPVWRP